MKVKDLRMCLNGCDDDAELEVFASTKNGKRLYTAESIMFSLPRKPTDYFDNVIMMTVVLDHKMKLNQSEKEELKAFLDEDTYEWYGDGE